jgi:hypothetical protein
VSNQPSLNESNGLNGLETGIMDRMRNSGPIRTVFDFLLDRASGRPHGVRDPVTPYASQLAALAAQRQLALPSGQFLCGERPVLGHKERVIRFTVCSP